MLWLWVYLNEKIVVGAWEWSVHSLKQQNPMGINYLEIVVMDGKYNSLLNPRNQQKSPVNMCLMSYFVCFFLLN